jgi:hypothetical protein
LNPQTPTCHVLHKYSTTFTTPPVLLFVFYFWNGLLLTLLMLNSNLQSFFSNYWVVTPELLLLFNFPILSPCSSQTLLTAMVHTNSIKSII